jgi:hypothetical protein
MRLRPRQNDQESPNTLHVKLSANLHPMKNATVFYVVRLHVIRQVQYNFRAALLQILIVLLALEK